MLIAKIVAAMIAVLAVGARMVMDFLWSDKRTKYYRWSRNAFIITALLAAIGNLVILYIDEARKKAAALEANRKQAAFENSSLGGVSPQIWLLYFKDYKLVCPRTNTFFPGNDFNLQIMTQVGMGPQPVFAMLVRNPYSFPIYDTDIVIINESPNLDNTTSLKTKHFHYPLLHADKAQITTFDAPEELLSKLVEFSVETKRGLSRNDVVGMDFSCDLPAKGGAVFNCIAVG